MPIVTFVVTRKKLTKGTVVFENVDAIIPTIYVRKGNPFAEMETLRITVDTVVAKEGEK